MREHDDNNPIIVYARNCVCRPRDAFALTQDMLQENTPFTPSLESFSDWLLVHVVSKNAWWKLETHKQLAIIDDFAHRYRNTPDRELPGARLLSKAFRWFLLQRANGELQFTGAHFVVEDKDHQ